VLAITLPALRFAPLLLFLPHASLLRAASLFLSSRFGCTSSLDQLAFPLSHAVARDVAVSSPHPLSRQCSTLQQRLLPRCGVTLPFFLCEAQTKALVRFVLSGIIFAFNTQCICSISALWLELHDSNACALAGQLCSRGRIWSAVCKMYVCMLYALVVGTFVGGWLMLTLCVHARLEVQRKGEERKKLQRGKRKRRSDGEGTGDFLLSLV